MEEFAIPQDVRNLLPLVGEAIILGVSPDLMDGFSDAEMQVLRSAGPGFFSLLEGRRLPEGFSAHFRDEVLRDMDLVRADASKRAEVRDTIRAILNDPERLKRLYAEGGDTFSDILNRAATVEKGMFRTPANVGEREKAASSTNFERAPRAGLNRRQL